jgi:hypothetical protein
MNSDQVLALIREELGRLSPEVAQRISSRMFTPRSELRTCMNYVGVDSESGEVWLFCTVPERDEVALVYSEQGYSNLGKRWGMVFVTRPHYGDCDGWYESLEHLLAENFDYFGSSSATPPT